MRTGNIELTNRVIIGGIIGSFIIVLLLIGIINDIVVKVKQFLQQMKDPDADDTKAKTDIIVFIYLNIFLILLHMISLLFRYVYPLTDSHCLLISKICLVLFHLTRTTQYIIFVRRIQVIYCGTIFDLRTKYIYILYSLIAVYALPYICYFNWTLMFHSVSTDDFGCSMRFHAALFFPQCFFDLFISLCGLYLFIFPLRALVQHQDDEELQNQIYNILIKYCLLYGTTIVSSLVLIIISFVFPFGFYYALLDGLFNAMMLILLHPEHNTCYKRICHVCRLCCIDACNRYALYKKNQKTILRPNPSSENPNHDPPRIRSPIKVPEIHVFFEIEFETEHNLVTDLKAATPLDVILTKSNAYKMDRDAKFGTGGLRALAEAEEPNVQSATPDVGDYVPRSLSNMYKQAAKKKASFKDVTAGVRLSPEPEPDEPEPRQVSLRKKPRQFKVRSNSEAVEEPKFITIAIDKALSKKGLGHLPEDHADNTSTEMKLTDHLDLSRRDPMHPGASVPSPMSVTSSHDSHVSGDSTHSAHSIHHLNTGLRSVTGNRLDISRQNTNSMSRSMNTIRLITYEASNL